jgi:hypothetical protein
VAVALKLQQISGKLFPFVYFYRRKKISESAEEENEIQAKPENYSELIFREPIRQKVQISPQKLLVKTKYKLVKANQKLVKTYATFCFHTIFASVDNTVV